MTAVLPDAGFLALKGRGYGLRVLRARNAGRSGTVRAVGFTNIPAEKPSGPSSDTDS